MRLDWIANPLLHYAIAGAGLVASMGLFLTLKIELRAMKRAGDSACEAVASRLREAEAAMEELRKELADTTEAAVRNIAQTPAMNLTRRTQALRMYHRGEPIETISGALHVPRNEIQLLIKLQEMTDRSRE